MAEFPAPWTDALRMRGALIKDGWVSPDTYDNFFADISNDPAVYLFLLYPRGEYDRAFVGYVGMSIKLGQRMRSHEVLSELPEEFWPMRWFKPTPKSELRLLERKYIAQFNPPWNIVGRSRGVQLQ